MRFSPFNPIYFENYGTSNDAMKDYTHVLSSSDHILIEVFHKNSEILPALSLINADTDTIIMSLSWSTIRFNETDCVSFYELKGLEVGCYLLRFGENNSNLIRVTNDDDQLSGTILMQYAMLNNYSRKDVYTRVRGQIRYFDFRVPGGFKDEGWSFSVETDQFLTPESDIVEICAYEATDKALTVGHSVGVPKWIGEMLNRISACNLIFIDGERYSITENSNVEQIGSNSQGDKFVYSITLRKARLLNADFEHQIRTGLRRTPTNYRKSDNNNLRGI